MFGLFKSKGRGPEPKYVNYLTKLEKYRQVAKLMQSEDVSNQIVVAYFFDQTGKETEQLFSAAGVGYNKIDKGSSLKSGVNIIRVSDFIGKQLTASKVYALEVHPVFTINNQLLSIFADSGLKKVSFFVGLDEPLMKIFGGERIGELLKRMDLKNDESIEHPMVSKSIERAQKKIEERAGTSSSVFSSQEDWMEANKQFI